MTPQMDPYATALVFKNPEGVEVYRCRATFKGANDLIDYYTRKYGSLTIDYVPCEPQPEILRGLF